MARRPEIVGSADPHPHAHPDPAHPEHVHHHHGAALPHRQGSAAAAVPGGLALSLLRLSIQWRLASAFALAAAVWIAVRWAIA